MEYHYFVESSDDTYIQHYIGVDVADAMAAFSKAISDGREYVMIEALRERYPECHASK